ncbi:cation diffusion facilitator CzcD-associated flavoprotein CzcO [Kineosphaera limosa]|uniref:Putative monooxygenase n=1 Tax=Kineosphaera limosa NBRC 100340 TaxID=1184609 RepID=K6WQ60_9MICO|nr:NAD(P)/FAD-dependent oxidoreductase [Kineosphaera limosa]NYE01250.1 cation diffusion facilitator CzcD-associated flavoprotein CzcO [Kineosphaera limosa]GAB95951.1 putative monooxygenase [Kineosphaera limosa NBRC 100340]
MQTSEPRAGSVGGDLDVLIVGAGVSGINVAYRLQERCPELSYRIVEAREGFGGTWDLFRYPGIRSDSDFFTLAFPFHPWRGDEAIVGGAQIMGYLREVVGAYGIDRHTTYSTKVTSADWSSAQARWRVECATPDGPLALTPRFLVVCTGYYDYDHPHDPRLPGVEDFAGRVVHPQFWPDDLRYTGARVAVVGSGATAVSLVPALADGGARVTMVQRTPSYVLAQPRRDALADTLRRRLPPGVAHQVMRVRNSGLQWGLFQACKIAPNRMRRLLRRGAVAGTGSRQVVDRHFDPPYNPWEQRLCIDPDGGFFTAIRDGQARVVTGAIERVVPQGLRMSDGTVVEADVLVTATGLSIKLYGGIDVRVDGAPVDAGAGYAYVGAMLSGVPNLAFCVGYLNMSWTMRSDLTARFVARVLRRLVDTGMDVVVPEPPPDLGPGRPLMDMPSGYLARAAHLMPRTTRRYPWAMKQNVVLDAWGTNRADLDNGLRWSRYPRHAVSAHDAPPR